MTNTQLRTTRDRHILPPQPTPFIGREAEITELVDLLAKPTCRLLSLVGPGGIGKTRLALEVAQRMVVRFKHGIFFVPLTPLQSGDDIVLTVINTLGIRIGDEGTPQEELIAFLSQRQILLLMDNFEHVLEGASLVADILGSAPNVKILATSREVLNLREEWVWRVRGLDFPQNGTLNHIEQYSGLRLFLDRAQQARHDFPAKAELTCAIEVCKLVDGIPLALELAASWLKTLTCEEIADEIGHNLDFLATNVRNLPDRHRSMRAVFNHSWALCSETEQHVFRRLCVFRNGFEREAAKQVTGASLQTLSSLVEKSMLRKLPSGRYDIQELLRQFAQEKLNEADEKALTYDRHMQYYAKFVQTRTPDIKGRRQLDGLNEIEADFENVRTAWLRAIEHTNHSMIDKMVEGLALFCDMRARYHDGDNLFQQAVKHLLPPNTDEIHPPLSRLCVHSVHVRALPEKISEPMLKQFLDMLSLAKSLDEPLINGLCLWLEGEIQRIGGDTQAARIQYRKALVIFEELNAIYYVGRTLRGLAFCDLIDKLPDSQRDQHVHRRHLTVTRDHGDRTGSAHAHLYESYYVDMKAEARMFLTALNIWREMGDLKSVGITQANVAQITVLQGEFDEADEMLAESWFLMEASGGPCEFDMDMAIGVNLMFKEQYHAGHDRLVPRIRHYPIDLFGNKRRVPLIKVLGLAMLGLVDKDSADQHIELALRCVKEYFFEVVAAGCLVVIAIILKRKGELVKAIELLGLAHTYADEYLMGWMHKWPLVPRTCDELQTELGTDAYDAAWERGEKRDIKATVAEMLDYFGNITETAQPVEQPLDEPLTARELEVLSLLASGHSNRKIADTLTVTIGTVKTHVYNICQKLDADNRTEAAVMARHLNLV